MWGSSCTSSSRYCSGETEEYFPVLYAADCECRPWDLNVFLSCTADCECWLWDLNVFLSCTADCVCRLWDLSVFLSCTADCECRLWDLNVFLSYTADCVCRLWDLNVGQLRSEFRLGSPGMSVRWHPQDPLKVGEERGKQRGGGGRSEEGRRGSWSEDMEY